MTENSPETNGDLGRRGLLRKGLIAGLGVAALSAATPAAALAAPRSARRTLKVSRPTPNAFTTQDHWYFCGQCKGIFWSGNGAPFGICPGGNPTNGLVHTPGQTEYYMPYGNASQPGLQLNWSYCTLCATLFWGPDMATSACPGNPQPGYGIGPHKGGKTVYDMMESAYFNGGTLQHNWRFCTRCKGLFWGNDTSSSVCEAAVHPLGPHNPGSMDYCLYF